LSVIVVCYLILVVFMAAFENSFIFFPSVYPDGDWQPEGLAFEDANFEADDGARLHGWYVPAANPKAVVLFAHGNAGNLTHRVDIIDALANALGASVLAFDYRGYGRSEGHPSEQGILADARAARRWLARRSGTSESQIVLMGESIGGAVMVDLAAHDGARALVLENTFSSLADVGAYHYPWLPVRLVMRSKFDSARKIRDYHGPLLMFHGDSDRIIPVQLGQRLFDAANEPKRLVVIPFGDHNDPRTRTAYEELGRFLSELPAVKSEPGKAEKR
jgi:fermentation-respiration switch protein FrsA (DUF1100 family)